MRKSASSVIKLKQIKVDRALAPKVQPLPRDILVPTPEWFTSSGPVDVSIIIPLFRHRKVLAAQIANWNVADDGISKEIIYVDDNCPEKPYMEIIKNWQPRRREIQRKKIGKIVVTSRSMGFGHVCNTGVKYAESKYLLFLMQNYLPAVSWIRPLVELLDFDSSVGAVGSMMLDGDVVQSCGAELNDDAYEQIGHSIYKGKKIKPFKLSELPSDLLRAGERSMLASSFAIERCFFEELNGFDASNLHWQTSIIEFMNRVKAKKKLWFHPNSRIVDISHRYLHDDNK